MSTAFSPCPACLKQADADWRVRHQAVIDSYGKVDLETFTRLSREAAVPPKTGESLSEEFTIGLSREGLFVVHYTAKCGKCQFAFSFVHEATTQAAQRLPFDPEAKPAGRKSVGGGH